MEIPFIGGSYEGRSKSLNAQRSINLFPVIDKQDAKSVVAMYGTPGLTEFCDTGTASRVRAMHVLGSYLYAVVGADVYKIATNGTVTDLGSITTSTGHVRMVDNGQQILIVDGTDSGHLIASETLSDISVGTDFPVATDCTFFDGYFLVSIKDTGRFAISDLYDGNSWTAIDFATAEAFPDNLVGITRTSQNVWLPGTESTEVYYNSGNADFPFERVPGAIIEEGCGAVGSITAIDGVAYWLTDKWQVVRSKGYSIEQISPPGVDYQISTYATKSDAIGYTWTLEGRTFYVLTFLTQDVTWLFSIDSGQWVEWSTNGGAHLGAAAEVFNGATLVGDKANGKIYTLSMDTYTDAGTAITRTRRTQTINKERVNVVHARVEVEFEPGVGLDVASNVSGYNPTATLKWSDDGGNTYSSGVSVPIGTYQSYGTRAIWRQLGMSRNRVYELTISDPVKVVLITTYANLIACGV